MVKLAALLLELVLAWIPKLIRDESKREEYRQAVTQAFEAKQGKAARQAKLRKEAKRVKDEARQKWRERWGRK